MRFELRIKEARIKWNKVIRDALFLIRAYPGVFEKMAEKTRGLEIE